MMENLKIEINQFQKKVDVGTHCDLRKLDIAINDAHEFDLPEILCDYWGVIVKIIDKYERSKIDPSVDISELEKQLIDGGHYECFNYKTFGGVRTALIYYSYARYFIGSSYNDTGHGFVSKTNEFSIPTPYKELVTISDEHRNKGYETCERIKEFICHYNAEFSELGFVINNCGSCECQRENCRKSETKGYRYRIKNISKYE